MKIPCEVIKDLLPLYIDDVCSDESRKMIIEHLAECKECKSELAAMQNELPIDIHEQELRDAHAIKNLSKKWKKSLLKSLLKGAVMTLLIIAVIAFILFFIADMRVMM
ncbi:MAG: zf-HC2 domain-containing protein [Lachnospiraceae bacterium]